MATTTVASAEATQPTIVPEGLGTDTTPTLNEEPPAESERVPAMSEQVQVGGFRFWMIFTSLMVTVFLSAMEMTSTSTALPRIVEQLGGTDFVWVGSAYSLAESAFLPLSGGLAQIFGRRSVVLTCLVLFTIGSGICGGARNLNMLIAGRTVAGLGGGGIISLSEIIIADLVPLNQRGTYMGLITGVWALASAIGPPLGGVLAENAWRWLFYLNLPLAGIATVLVSVFLNLKSPKEDFKTKMKRMDWIGNLLIIASTTITIIALTWAGVYYPWTSAHVLVPLILGGASMVAFFIYEAKFAYEPVVPWVLINSRTGLMGYLTAFFQVLTVSTTLYYLPVYFQGALGQTPLHSGTSLFGIAFTVAPFATLGGVSIAKFGKYLPQHYVGWCLIIIGTGLLTLLKASSNKGEWVGFQIIAGAGYGIVYIASTFPVLAATPVTEAAHALAFLTFVRTYSVTWGIAIGAVILQNQLKQRLPADFLAQYPTQGAEIAYSVIPSVRGLQEPLRGQVEDAFAKSIRIIWFTMLGCAFAGLLTCVLMKELKMHETTDEDWGMKQEKVKDVEKSDQEKRVSVKTVDSTTKIL